jgi:UDP-N-acetylglucosamine--N-acetylmuramyl-(pentapeptide) pyrophosphoryl-undecaprenol N-acetylglucosamine transferase
MQRTAQLKRLVLTGGGTGGHIFPALALGRAFLDGNPEGRVLFVGGKRGMEARLVPEAGLDFLPLPARGFFGKGLLHRIRFLGDLAVAALKAIVALRRFRPDAVLATGGYASLPSLIAARLLRIPIFLLEQNSVPGRTIRMFASTARLVFLAYSDAAERLPRGAEYRLTGNPLRREFLELAGRGSQVEDSDHPRRRLLIFGGSQGAHSLNVAAREGLPRLQEQHDFEALIQTGERDFPETRDILAPGSGGLEARSFVENMPEEMARSHWVVCRCGAMTLSEITLMGLPAILVPLPGAIDDHQLKNGQVLERAGAAVIIPDGELTGERLAATLADLWRDPRKEREMAAASKSCGHPDATGEVLDLMEKSLAGPRGW